MNSEFVFALVIAIGVAFVVGLATVYLSHYLAEITNLTDDPDRIRKLHDESMPTSGGVGIFVAFGAGIIVILNLYSGFSSPILSVSKYFTASIIIITLTGLYDDFNGLSSRPKFIMQIFSGLILLTGIHLHVIPSVASYAQLSNLMLFPIYVGMLFWIVAVCNMINLVDGVDGLASTITLLILFGMAWIGQSWETLAASWIVYPLLGAVAAFLIYNRPPASIFMGDTGSLMIGFSLAAASILLVIHASHWMYSLSLIVLFGVPMIDTLLSIIRRIKEGQNPFESDSNHLHHIIQRHYNGPSMAIVILGGVSMLLVMLGILLANTVDSILFSTVFGMTIMLFIITVIAYVKQLDRNDSIVVINLYEAPSIAEADLTAIETLHNNAEDESFDVAEHRKLRQFSNN
ncbi:MAG: MraY family glycosyltransferase [Bacteroidota bacterium]